MIEEWHRLELLENVVTGEWILNHWIHGQRADSEITNDKEDMIRVLKSVHDNKVSYEEVKSWCLDRIKYLQTLKKPRKKWDVTFNGKRLEIPNKKETNNENN